MHGEELVEPGDLERTPRLEAGSCEQEPVPILQFRPRLDQDAERGRVDELDLAEIDDDPLWSLGAGLGEGSAHLRSVVEIEFTPEANHAGGAHGLHPEHRVLAQAVSSAIPPVSQSPSRNWLCERHLLGLGGCGAT